MASDPIDEIVRDCLGFRVRLLGRATTGLYDHALKAHGLSIGQANLMAALGKLGPCSPARLGEVLQMDRSTVSRNLSLLLKQGWAEAVSSDAKGVREVTLSPAGHEKIRALLPEWRRAQEETARLLGPEGVDAIRTLASRVGNLPPGL